MGIALFTFPGSTGKGVLIEDSVFRFYTINIVQGPGDNSDIVIRRSLILDSFNELTHAQGLFLGNVSVLLEENIFDHNGWFIQQVSPGANIKDEGMATFFNHNTYTGNSHGVIFRGNSFLRASSIANKFTAEGEDGAGDIIIDNNLYVDGEIAMSIGGNDNVAPYRFTNMVVTNNVMLDMGLSQPTNRTLGWYVDINDWDVGAVTHNLFLNKANPAVTNVYAIRLVGKTKDVRIADNIVYGLGTDEDLVILEDGANVERISFVDNIIQSHYDNATLVSATASLDNYTFSGNRYYATGALDEWFQVAGTNLDFSGWESTSSESGAVVEEVIFPDPDRTIQNYQTHLGKPASMEAFIEEVRQQSKYNWRREYTADSVNSWVREGFGVVKAVNVTPDPVVELPMERFSLQAWPNPFDSQVSISLSANGGFVNGVDANETVATMRIFDLQGRQVYSAMSCASQTCTWNGRNSNQSYVTAGVYFVRITTAEAIYHQSIVKIGDRK